MLSKRMADGIGFSFVVKKLECFSYYGNEKIREINAAFIDSVTLSCYKNEVDPASCFQNISKLMGLRQCLVSEIQDLLSNFKNIRGIVNKLEFSCLSEVELYEVKRFLLGLEKFIDLWSKTEIRLDGIYFAEMTEALSILDPKSQRIAAFSICDENLPALKSARQEKANIEALIDKHGMTEELMKKRTKIVAEEDKHEQAALIELTSKLRPYAQVYITNMDGIGLLDFTLAKAVLAIQTGAALPIISPRSIRLINMWNPKTQAELEKKGRVFAKTSIDLNPGATILIGANMGGKSLTIKTVLLNMLLANMGFCVFAKEAHVPLFDDVFFIEEGVGDDFLSSFGAEIMQINDMTKTLMGKRLFIAMDEPARTTNPTEGAKIVKGLVSYLSKQKSTSLISTHFDNVQENAQAVYQTASFSYDGIEKADVGNLADFIKYELKKVDQEAIVPTEAINLCKILGMDPSLLAEINTSGV